MASPCPVTEKSHILGERKKRILTVRRHHCKSKQQGLFPITLTMVEFPDRRFSLGNRNDFQIITTASITVHPVHNFTLSETSSFDLMKFHLTDRRSSRTDKVMTVSCAAGESLIKP